MRNIVNVLLIVDIGIVIFCFLSGQRAWLINTQIGFFSSTLILFASMMSYRSMVEKRLQSGDTGVSGDVIDDMDEKYDFVEDKEQDPQELIKEIKKESKQDKRSFIGVLKDSKPSLSFYRLGAYGVLAMGFLYLNNNHLLHIASYLFSLAIPITIFVVILLKKS